MTKISYCLLIYLNSTKGNPVVRHTPGSCLHQRERHLSTLTALQQFCFSHQPSQRTGCYENKKSISIHIQYVYTNAENNKTFSKEINQMLHDNLIERTIRN